MTYKVISLFSGIGGLDAGFGGDVVVHKNSIANRDWISRYEPNDFVVLNRLPFDVVFQNDISKPAKQILHANKWNRNFHDEDITQLLEKEDFQFPKAQIIIGGFPCQDFSHAGKRAGFTSERGNLYKSFAKVVERIKPVVFIAENVHGLLTMKTNPLETIKRDFAALGYDVYHQLVKCEEYGIPQKRWRVIILGVRNDLNKSIACPFLVDNKCRCEVAKYFAHLDEPDETIDPAQMVYSKAKELPSGQGQTEINLLSFAPTIRAEHHGNIEFRRKKNGVNKENDKAQRRLTVREAALIQTFPPGCVLTEPKKSMMAYKPIGNAVPPLLSYIIAKKVLEILQDVDSS